VISTRPDVGQELEKGSNVVLVVSSGKERVAVPKVVGLTEDEARSTLESVGFKVSSKEQETTDAAKVGKVTAQDPTGGSRPKGSTVAITVGKEPAEVDVPDVGGAGRLAATAELKKAGFVVNQVTQKTGDRTQDLHVITQDPATGGKAKKGSTVTITVGEYDPSLGTSGDTTTTPSSAVPGNTETTQ
jgi:serine/threonine-protein kinase